MGATDGRPDAVRAQVALILNAAAKIAGGRVALSKRLGVPPYLIAEWTAKLADAPDEVVHAAIEMILDRRRPGRG